MTNLNEKQIKFCEEYVANGYVGRKAYAAAYDQKDANSAGVGAAQLLRDPRIVDKIKDVEGDYRIIGYRLGINKKFILQRLVELLSAEKQVFFNGRIVGSVSDNASVNKALDTLIKIFGDFSAEKKEIAIDDAFSDVDISKLSKEERKELKDAILKSL